MYIHLGMGVVVREEDVVGIFDMENTTVMRDTVNYLVKAEKSGEAFVVAPYELPKSFVVCEKNGKRRVHISPVSVGTVLKRTEKQGQ